ncbi:MAG: protoglobin domain-containing protein [Woeseiaceae bacterium]|jgi:methyl-accepting chemotaxis protein
MPYTELIEDRLRFIEIEESDIVELQQAREYIEPHIDDMLERFYTHILSYPEFKALFEDAESIDRARASQKAHWLEELFGGHFTSSYFNKADKIGRTHARVGLAPSWYVGSYSKMLAQFIDRICEESEKEGRKPCETIQAVCKAVLLDVDLVTHCYLEAKNEAMRQVLSRATGFADDMADLTKSLGATSNGIQSAAAELAEAESGSTVQPEQVSNLLGQIESLVEQTDALQERIGELQFGDRLYIESDPTTLDRLKSLFSGN